MELTPKILKKMVMMVKMTKSEEIGCDDCFDEMNEFAEMELAGKSPERAMPLVEEHINRCRDCKEEYEALVEAMKSLKDTS